MKYRAKAITHTGEVSTKWDELKQYLGPGTLMADLTRRLSTKKLRIIVGKMCFRATTKMADIVDHVVVDLAIKDIIIKFKRLQCGYSKQNCC